jgi:hypothetical protein
MTIQEIRRLYAARPFQPFSIHLADGRAIQVRLPEFMASAPRGRTVVVYQPDGTFDVVDLLLVTDLEVKPDGGQSGGDPAE